jgi:hypothetical protein
LSTITDALVLEHAVFRTVFDQVERAIAKASSTGGVRLLSTVVEDILKVRGETEKNLAYSALDHVLKEDGRLSRLHQDHHEIDEDFKRVHRANHLAEARLLLKMALEAMPLTFLSRGGNCVSVSRAGASARNAGELGRNVDGLALSFLGKSGSESDHRLILWAWMFSY